MIAPNHRKVTPQHLSRKAWLYVRQSTLRQVVENTESTERQYALRDRAIALGWPAESIEVIDSDLGRSGARSVDRAGFRRLVSEAGMGNAGIVMGLEVSRLARKSSDWHHLLEICALTETLLLDEDDVYDPRNFNDRLVLGLKGTMSEAELHVQAARMRGAILSKAQRGELAISLPVGFVYDHEGKVRLDPDEMVRGAIRHLFETFRRTGTVYATVRCFRREGLTFPRRPRHGPRQGKNIQGPLTYSQAQQILHNPRYMGAFAYGRRKTWKDVEGRSHCRALHPEEWLVFLPEAHEGYITRPEYEENLRRLAENSPGRAKERGHGPPREGRALLQGLAICGKCGCRMSVQYHVRRGGLSPDYICAWRNIERTEPRCETISGAALDEAVGRLLLDLVTPLTIDVALAVQAELQTRLDEADALRKKTVDRANYEAEQARRRYMQVDPDNRLVAASLEAEWNGKLRSLSDAQEEYERRKGEDRSVVDEATRGRLDTLLTDFPRLWQDPSTPMREKKRMAKLLVEDVTILRGPETTLHVRLKGGATRTLTVQAPLAGKKTSPELLAEIDRLLDDGTEAEVAAELDRRGRRSRSGQPVSTRIIGVLRRNYGLKSRYDRLREKGLLTIRELAEHHQVGVHTIHRWRREGRLTGVLADDKGTRLYAPPGPDSPKRQRARRSTAKNRHLPQSSRSQ